MATSFHLYPLLDGHIPVTRNRGAVSGAIAFAVTFPPRSMVARTVGDAQEWVARSHKAIANLRLCATR
jgi:hypothetical protein